MAKASWVWVFTALGSAVEEAWAGGLTDAGDLAAWVSAGLEEEALCFEEEARGAGGGWVGSRIAGGTAGRPLAGPQHRSTRLIK